MTRVVVTRASQQATELSRELSTSGFEVVEVPVITIVEPDDGGAALRAALGGIDHYDWLVVTSVNTVERISPFIVDVPGKIAAIGPATAGALSVLGLTVDLVPPQYVAESLVAEFPAGEGKVLLPRAEVARDVLPDGLRQKGWMVDVVVAYKTVAAQVGPDALQRLDDADVITFTASSTVENFVDRFGVDRVPGKVACIGPVTAKTAEQLGVKVDVVAAEHTIPGLVRALLDL